MGQSRIRSANDITVLQIPLAHIPFGQVLVALPQVAPEVQRAVAVNLGVGQLDLVQHVANLGALSVEWSRYSTNSSNARSK
jgi:hypothetical protein